MGTERYGLHAGGNLSTMTISHATLKRTRLSGKLGIRGRETGVME